MSANNGETAEPRLAMSQRGTIRIGYEATKNLQVASKDTSNYVSLGFHLCVR